MPDKSKADKPPVYKDMGADMKQFDIPKQLEISLAFNF